MRYSGAALTGQLASTAEQRWRRLGQGGQRGAPGRTARWAAHTGHAQLMPNMSVERCRLQHRAWAPVGGSNTGERAQAVAGR